jgi:Peptide methionine sulfoxide reductase
MALALASRANEQQLRRRPITTEVVPAGPFYSAEPYHQRLYERAGTGALGATCALSDPKSWLALAGPEDPSHRNGGMLESGESQGND